MGPWFGSQPQTTPNRFAHSSQKKAWVAPGNASGKTPRPRPFPAAMAGRLLHFPNPDARHRTTFKHPTTLSLLQPAGAAGQRDQPAMGAGYSHLVHAQEPAASFRIADCVVPVAHRHSNLPWVCFRPRQRLMESVWMARPRLLSDLRAAHNDCSCRGSVFSNDLYRTAIRDAVDNYFLQLSFRGLSGIVGSYRPGSADAGKAEHLVERLYECCRHSGVLCNGLDGNRPLAPPGLSDCGCSHGNAWGFWLLEAAFRVSPCV